MPRSTKPDAYLVNRNGHYQYRRMVPLKLQPLVGGQFSVRALKTDSLTLARKKRDKLAEADDEFWLALRLQMTGDKKVDERLVEVLRQTRVAAIKRAEALGFSFQTVEDLATHATPLEIVRRIEAISEGLHEDEVPSQRDRHALLGTVVDPRSAVTVSIAFEEWIDKISYNETAGKSEQQVKDWEKRQRIALKQFMDVVGDLQMDQITREVAHKWRDYWIARMKPKSQGGDGVSPNTANKRMDAISVFCREYHSYHGLDYNNPFAKLRFDEKKAIGDDRKRASYDDEFVRKHFLKPGMFDRNNEEGRCILMMLIETGARPSEIANLQPEDIVLDHPVPHIHIRPHTEEDKKRVLKTPQSKRKIPLVGVALEAAKRCPNGFPRYRENGNTLSAILLKWFEKKGLRPTKDHVVYSLRHAFEDRMKRAKIDYELRLSLFGHKNARPDYGEGLPLDHVRDLLQEMAHPYDPAIFERWKEAA